MKDKKVVVVKYGSKCVVNGTGLNQAKIDEYARKLVALHNDYRTVVVASGSVAAGKRFWVENSKLSVPDSQVLAAIGSAGANEAWRLAFKKQMLFTGQILLTHRELEDDDESDNLLSALRKLFQHDVLPVINENDILSTKELKKLAYGGDNDGLAARLAIKLSAEAVLFLTDVDGYIEDGIVKRHAKLKDMETYRQYLHRSNEEGTGSMESKLSAASEAVRADIRAYVASAEVADYQKILDGKVGTEVRR